MSASLLLEYLAFFPSLHSLPLRFYGALRTHIKEGLHERRERMATCNFTLSADGLWRFLFFSFCE